MFSRKYRRLATRNLEIASANEKSPRELRQLVRRHFRRLGANLLCSAKLTQMPAEKILEYVEVENIESMTREFRVGVPVVLQTSSRDVIHSFWAPNIQGKRDLIPGYTNAIWFQVDKEGTYRGQCAEFCGHQHAHMAFYVVAESVDKFSAWLDGQRKPAPDPTNDVQKRGQSGIGAIGRDLKIDLSQAAVVGRERL